MPKTKKQPATPRLTTPVPPVTEPLAGQIAAPRPTASVVYDRVEALEYSTVSPKGPVTPERMRVILNWENEKEYQKRMMRENPGSKPEHWLFGETGPRRKDNGQLQPIHCLDTDKVKVVCWNNANNRPFDMVWKDNKVAGWCGDIVNMILHGQWAGPLTVPGETVNGETIRISRYGRVLSGQHQGTALILADELLQKSRLSKDNILDPEYPFWNGHAHCVIESIVVTGLSEDERILRTIDYVKPRTEADMLYTMDLFRDNTPASRKELTRMLSAARALLWHRTATKGYETHPEVVGFLERHRRLLRCVEHLFKENTNRAISKLRLSAGQCAALCYLMAGAGPDTDGDVYRNECPPSERGLDWSLWDRAHQFWSGLARDRALVPVQTSLGRLLDSTSLDEDNQGLGGRLPEKLSILAKAWAVFKDHSDHSGPVFAEEDMAPGGALCLSYTDLDAKGNKLPNDQIALIPEDDFGGIDCPKHLGEDHMPRPPSPDEIWGTLTTEGATEKLRQEALERRATVGAKK